jgi:hypothetical protein
MRHLAALPCALLAQTIQGTWQGTLTPPNQHGELRMVFKIDKNVDAPPDLFEAFEESEN